MNPQTPVCLSTKFIQDILALLSKVCIAATWWRSTKRRQIAKRRGQARLNTVKNEIVWKIGCLPQLFISSPQPSSSFFNPIERIKWGWTAHEKGEETGTRTGKSCSYIFKRMSETPQPRVKGDILHSINFLLSMLSPSSLCWCRKLKRQKFQSEIINIYNYSFLVSQPSIYINTSTFPILIKSKWHLVRGRDL